MSNSVSLLPNTMRQKNREYTTSKARARHSFKSTKKALRRVKGLSKGDRAWGTKNVTREHRETMSSLWKKHHNFS